MIKKNGCVGSCGYAPASVKSYIIWQYFRATIKGKIFQLRFLEEINPDDGKAERSGTTGHLGAKYLVFVSSRSVKMSELSMAQFVYFLRKVKCVYFSNF